MKVNYVLYALMIFSLVAYGCTQKQSQSMEDMEMDKSGSEDLEFKQMCQDAGYEWMLMKPTQDGKIIQNEQMCMGCMVEGIEHVCDKEKFMDLMKK